MTQDLKARLEKLMADAADCDLIASLAADLKKRATFRRIAEQFRTMAAELRREIAVRETNEKRIE
jgi:hypothetical protein